jgi:hypothetical protein
MNMPQEVILALKKTNDTAGEKKQEVSPSNIKNGEMLSKINNSYKDLNNKVTFYNKKIRILRKDADNLKEEININKNISGKDKYSEASHELDKKQKIQNKIESNNHSLCGETCSTAIDHINTIKLNISKNSKSAKKALAPLENSLNLLKMQVKYTLLLESILDLFNKKKAAESKLNNSNQIITMLAESLGVDEK